MAGDRIADDARVRAIETRRLVDEDEAQVAQLAYRRCTALFVVCSAIAGISSGLILYGEGAGQSLSQPATEGMWLSHTPARQYLFAIQAISLFGAALGSALLGLRDYANRWQRARERAEAGRVAQHALIMEIAGQLGGPALIQAFDHLVSNLLQPQIGYYLSRSREHAASATRLAWVTAVVLGLVAASGAVGASWSGWVTVVALTGVVSPVILTALRSWQQQALSDEKSSRYKTVWSELVLIAGEVEMSRKLLESGDSKAAFSVAERLFATLRQEHQGFRATGEIEGQKNGSYDKKKMGDD
jgi:hypothetical protein